MEAPDLPGFAVQMVRGYGRFQHRDELAGKIRKRQDFQHLARALRADEPAVCQEVIKTAELVGRGRVGQTRQGFGIYSPPWE